MGTSPLEVIQPLEHALLNDRDQFHDVLVSRLDQFHLRSMEGSCSEE